MSFQQLSAGLVNVLLVHTNVIVKDNTTDLTTNIDI